jgi:hypothetical protein
MAACRLSFKRRNLTNPNPAVRSVDIAIARHDMFAVGSPHAMRIVPGSRGQVSEVRAIGADGKNIVRAVDGPRELNDDLPF